jgi:hypothetical protein
MTQRSILTGDTPTVVIRAGGEAHVQGQAGDRVLAETDSRWGLKVERRSATQIGRARAKVGDRVLFDWRLDLGRGRKGPPAEVTEVEIGGSGKVVVPLGSRVKVYAGQGVEVRDVQGSVAVYAGGDARTRNVGALAHASAGGALDVECESVEGDEVNLQAGRDLRCHVRGLADARIMVNDLGGEWEGVIGAGRLRLRLRAGGDVTLVTDQEVAPQPPDYVVGKVEKPHGQEGTESGESSGEKG